MAQDLDRFQGVICHRISGDSSQQATIDKLLNTKTTSMQDGLQCSELELSNKYYKATIHLFDLRDLTEDKKNGNFFSRCHAIILQGDGQTVSIEKLDKLREELSSVSGEPRIFLYDGGSDAHQTLLDWCIKNSFDLIDADDDDASNTVIDSLSAYKWKYRESVSQKEVSNEDPRQLDDGVMQKLADFDNLLEKIKLFKDSAQQPSDPDNADIMEIATLLGCLLGDDVDDFLDTDESDLELDVQLQKRQS